MVEVRELAAYGASPTARGGVSLCYGQPVRSARSAVSNPCL